MSPHSVPHQSPQVTFVLLCLLGIIVIVVALGIEGARVRNGKSALGGRVFRWRLASGGVWCLMLSMFAYAAWFLWPAGASHDTKIAFARVMSASTGLLIIAFILLILDMRLVLREMRRGEQLLQRQMSNLVNESQRKSDRIRRELPPEETATQEPALKSDVPSEPF